jgi:NTE family protein
MANVHPTSFRSATKSPSIGIALGGGVARGFAHIGILKTLLAHGLRPHVITGTSIGALIGGLCAAGQLAVVEEWALGLSRRRVLGYLDVSLRGSGLINGERLARHLEAVIGRTMIESLGARFAAVATELSTGHEVWLTRGRLVEALRASYALPGVFAPVRIGGRWLVDGALVNPVPVSTARALDTGLVIAVNLNSGLIGRGSTILNHGYDEDDHGPAIELAPQSHEMISVEKVLKRQIAGDMRRPRLSKVMIEAYNVMQDRITRAKLAGDPPDITISPRLGNIGLFDFHRAGEAIARGVEAAERALDTIDQAVAAL